MKKKTLALLALIKSKILQNKNLFLGQRVGIATSGGVDSMVLLDTFSRFSKKYKFILYSLHYNHKWRKDSILDKKLVEDYCKKNNINFIYGETKGKVTKKEEVARHERYSFFRKSLERYGLSVICTAHHLDDQVETVFFRLLRGTGPQGLLPIKELVELDKNTKIFRPLLSVSKNEIQLYARQNKINFNEDKTNVDLQYKRNLIRKKIIPLLKEVHKDAGRNLILCSGLIHAQSEVLKDYFLNLLRKLKLGNKYTWSRDYFLNLRKETQKTFLYWYFNLNGIKGSVSKLGFIINEITCISLGLQGFLKKIDLDKNFYLEITNNKITFIKKQVKNVQSKKSLKINFLLNSKKEKIFLGKRAFLRLEPYKYSYFSWEFPKDSKKVSYVDLSKFVGRKLTLRYRNSYDKFQPLGFKSKVKLKKYLINKKVPYKTRYNLPLLCYKSEVLWIPGYSLSEKLKVIERPTHVLRLVKS